MPGGCAAPGLPTLAVRRDNLRQVCTAAIGLLLLLATGVPESVKEPLNPLFMADQRLSVWKPAGHA